MESVTQSVRDVKGVDLTYWRSNAVSIVSRALKMPMLQPQTIEIINRSASPAALIDWYCQNDDISRQLFYLNTERGFGNAGEFYIALLTGGVCELNDNQEGYDVLVTDFRTNKTYRLSVKTLASARSFQWNTTLKVRDNALKFDYLVVCGLRQRESPSRSTMFVIPADDILRQHPKENGVIQVKISKDQFHAQSGKQNRNWEYRLSAHTEIMTALKLSTTEFEAFEQLKLDMFAV